MTTLNFPTNPTDGDEYLAPNGVLYVWEQDVNSWRGSLRPINIPTVIGPTGATGATGVQGPQGAAGGPGVLPPGSIIVWSGAENTIPNGWLLCDGTNGTPDLRDKFIVGAGGNYAVNATGGNKDAIVVSHDHTGTTNTAGSHSHSMNFYSVSGGNVGAAGFTGPYANYVNMDAAGAHTHTFNTSSTGTSSENANLPPYYALCYIMKDNTSAGGGLGSTTGEIGATGATGVTGATGPQGASGINLNPTVYTDVKVASGTFVDFTNIPSNVHRITVTFYALNTNGTASIQAQVGTSTGIKTSGYVSSSQSTYSSLTGLLMTPGAAPTGSYLGTLTLNKLVNSALDTWVASCLSTRNDANTYYSAGAIYLGLETLTTLRITTYNPSGTGTNIFNAGFISLKYE
jgi:hypothetical protein